MSILYSPNFKHLEGELRKNQEFMASDFHHLNQQQQQQQNSGLMRYRSAPSSVFGSHLDSGCEDFRYARSSSPEVETILERFISKSQDVQDFGLISTKQEVDQDQSISPQHGYFNGSEQIMFQNQVQGHEVINSMALENSMQAKMGSGNRSDLVRQSSSPAGFFSNLNVENGFTITRDMGNLRACNGTDRQASSLTSRLNGNLNFSSGPSSRSRLMPQIAENRNEGIGATSPENVSLGNGNASKRGYMPSFTTDSWDDSTFNGLKRARNDDGNMLSDLSALDSENCEPGRRPPPLTHHLSLPKTSTEMAAIEKFLQFQGPVPIKIRAKRGCATHPRSIAERVRRTRISERMRKLQELFPDMDKQTNTADMLDLAVEHIKNLQKQVKTLTDTKAKCKCTSIPKKYSNLSA